MPYLLGAEGKAVLPVEEQNVVVPPKETAQRPETIKYHPFLRWPFGRH